MSQINNNPTIQTSYHESNVPQQVNTDNVPQELQNARPASSSSSGWKLAGRIALGITTIGLSELFRLAYLGIKSLLTKASPAPARESRLGNAQGLPNAAPQDDKINQTLASALSGKTAFPKPYQDVVDATLGELRTQYGSKYIPEGATLLSLSKSINTDIDPHGSRNFFFAIKNAPSALSPQNLQQIIKENLVPMLNRTFLCNIAAEKANDLGGMGDIQTSTVVQNLLSQPGIANKVNSVTNINDLQNIAKEIGLDKKITEYRSTVCEGFAELRAVYGSDIVPEDITKPLAFRNDGNNSIAALLNKRITGHDVSMQELKASLKEVATPILQQKAIERELTSRASEMNVPLTRRGIVRLAISLIKNADNQQLLSNVNSKQSLQKALGAINIDQLLSAQKTAMDNAYLAHSGKLAKEVKPIFRTFLEGCSFAPGDAEATNNEIEAMVNRMKEWKNISATNQPQNSFNDYFKQVIGKDLKMLEGVPGNTDTTTYHDNIYHTLFDDAHRSVYEINGTKIQHGDPNTAAPQLTQKIKEELPNPKDQQFMSKLINQRLWANVINMSSMGTLENGDSIETLPGGTNLPHSFIMQGQQPILVDRRGVPATFTVQISPDKTTAEIRSNRMFDTCCYENVHVDDDKQIHFGSIDLSFTIKVNLSAHEDGQGVQDVQFSQNILPFDQVNK